MEVREIRSPQKEELVFDDFSISTRSVNHGPESLAYRIQAGGIAMVYSGDTDVSDALVELTDIVPTLLEVVGLPGASHGPPAVAAASGAVAVAAAAGGAK